MRKKNEDIEVFNPSTALGDQRPFYFEEKMCRMFAAASKETINPAYFKAFGDLSLKGKVIKNTEEAHEDGWGISGCLGNWTVHFGRSAKGVSKDRAYFSNAAEKALKAKSKIIISHLRKASQGDVSLSNAHPFIHNEWIFCHNGTINDAQKLKITNFLYEGTADSEIFFRYLVSRLSHKNRSEFSTILENAAKYIKENFKTTSLTLLMSNGDYLYAFRDFSKDDYYYTLYYKKTDLGYIFCSEPLDKENWIEMKNGQLVIVSKFGEEVYNGIIKTSTLTKGPEMGIKYAENASRGD